MRYYLSIIVILIMAPLLMAMPANAMVKNMPDGGRFDARYYAERYPDVAGVYGSDEDSLYAHYLMYGMAEGRLPYRGATGKRGIVITGDSRANGLIYTLHEMAGYENTYLCHDGNAVSAIFKKGNIRIVIAGFGGGNLTDHSYDLTLKNALALIGNEYDTSMCESYKFIDLYGLNDVLLHPETCLIRPSEYITRDTAFISTQSTLDKMYHLNAGPISDEGFAHDAIGLTNETIAEYNKLFTGNDRVRVVNLFNYLKNNGYKAVITDEDPSGIHYDDATNRKIISLILSL